MNTNIWKRVLTLVCVVALLMTHQGVTVLANEDMAINNIAVTVDEGSRELEAEDEYIEESDQVINETGHEELGQVIDETGPEEPDQVIDETDPEESEQAIGETDLKESDQAIDKSGAEESNQVTNEIESEESSQIFGGTDISVIDNYDEEFLINDENNDSDVTEGLVGTNTWTVSKNVTAKLVKEGKKNVLYLESKGGQLSEPTPSNIWDFWFTVIDTDVVSNVNVIKLTDNSTKLYLPKTNFGTFWGRNFHNLEEVYFNKMDISKSTALDGMFGEWNQIVKIDLSGLTITKGVKAEAMLTDLDSLETLITPKKTEVSIKLPKTMYDASGKAYTKIPAGTGSITLKHKPKPYLLFDESEVTLLISEKNFFLNLETDTDGNITYKSSNPAVATVNKNSGIVTIKGVGTTTITATSSPTEIYDSGSDSYKLTVEDNQTSISDCIFTISPTSFTYDGNPKKPVVQVQIETADDCTDELINGKNYTVAYTNNTNAGTAYVKVIGIGEFKGEKTLSFKINKAAPKITFSESSVTKTLKDGSFTNKLSKTTDGTVVFKSSNTGVATIDNASGFVTIKGTGTTTITATASAGTNYKAGSANYALTVVDGRTDISTCTVTLSPPSYTYNGSAKKPTVTVKNGSTALKSGTDYTVVYKNNINAGTATITVTGKGNYIGTNSKTFTIKKAASSLKFVSASVEKTTLDMPFTNKLTKTTDGTVTFKSSDRKVAVVDSASGLVTIKGTGTTTITATASAGTNYKAGSATYALTVVDGRADISTYTVTLSPTSYIYNGSAKKPTITVKNGSTALKSGTDYTVVYKNNINVGTATAIVTGKGSYTGTNSKTFTIKKAASSLKFASSSIKKTTLDMPFTNKLTKTTDGTVTFKSSDRTVATVNSTNGLVTIRGIGTAIITATTTAGKNYKAGSANYTIEVTKGVIDIEKCEYALNPSSYTYNGSAKKPAVTVTYQGTDLIKGTDYNVTYSDNVNAGTARVIVTGIDDFEGEHVLTFAINKATPILKFECDSIIKNNLDKPFTNMLSKKTDGTITYKSGNTAIATVNSKTGEVTIKGVGTVTLTAVAAAGKNYKARNIKYILKVMKKEIIPVYRLFNTRTGEHFYTASMAERSQYLKAGNWNSEGIAWYAPKTSSEPIYRLSNPNNGDEHHYTKSKSERDQLVELGWHYDTIAWYSDTEKIVPIYRHYHPIQRTGNHHYTTSKGESDHIVKYEGWRYEGISFYVSKAGG